MQTGFEQRQQFSRSSDEQILEPHDSTTGKQGLADGRTASLAGEHQIDRPVSAVLRFVIPVDQIMYVGDANQCQIVVQRNLEGLGRVGVAIGDLDAVELSRCSIGLMEFGDFGFRVGEIAPGVIPEHECALFAGCVQSGLGRPFTGIAVVLNRIEWLRWKGGLKETIGIADEHRIHVAEGC